MDHELFGSDSGESCIASDPTLAADTPVDDPCHLTEASGARPDKVEEAAEGSKPPAVDQGQTRQAVELVFSRVPAGIGRVTTRLLPPRGARKPDGKPVLPELGWCEWTGVPDNIAALVRMIERDGNKATRKGGAWTVALIPALFRKPAMPGDKVKASEDNVTCCPALVVECDERPDQAAHKAAELLGSPSMVVESGGTWIDPETGEVQAKRHLYYLLDEPAVEVNARRKLRLARDLVAELVGSDKSAAPLSHPMRWPGSQHLKDPANPRPCRIAHADPAMVVQLDDVVAKLENLVGLEQLPLVPRASREAMEGSTGNQASHPAEIGQERALPDDDLMALALAIPNDGLAWDAWNKIGMALYRASGGSDAGRIAFHAFSEKWPSKYQPADVNDRWNAYHQSPPNRIGAGTLVRHAVEARRGRGGFLLPSVQAAREEAERRAAERLPIDHADLLEQTSETFRKLVELDEKLRSVWFKGKSINGKGHATPEVCERELAAYLSRRLSNGEIEVVLRLYPYGSIGSGELTGHNADQRIGKLLRMVAEQRSKVEDAAAQPGWWQHLKFGKSEPKDNLKNVATVLRLDPKFADKVRFDQMANCAVVKGLPWDQPSDDWREVDDNDIYRIAEYVQGHDFNAKPATVKQGIATVAIDHCFHPIRDYLQALKWDGVPRIGNWLTLCAGAKDTPYTRGVGRKFLISAVARIMKPGCKADHSLTLIGGQGPGKSRLIAAMVPNQRWFSDQLATIGTKDAEHDLFGKWIYELPELAAMKRSSVEAIKAFMSRGTSRFRPAYGLTPKDHPRQTVFIGTTNTPDFITDPSGGRRFWPVQVEEVGPMNIGAMVHCRGQLWAEAFAAYRAGENWWLDQETEALAREEQELRQVEDPWAGKVEDWLATQLERRVADARSKKARQTDEDIDRIEVSFHRTGDILERALKMDRDRQDARAGRRLAGIMRKAGYVNGKPRVNGENGRTEPRRGWHLPKDASLPVPPDADG